MKLISSLPTSSYIAADSDNGEQFPPNTTVDLGSEESTGALTQKPSPNAWIMLLAMGLVVATD